MFANDTVIIYDLEFTSWEGYLASKWTLPGKHREIVQIGAVKLRPSQSFAEIGSFASVVRPNKHPVLSDYFIDLTGISQDQVDREGVAFAEALRAFLAFIGSEPADVGAFGVDADVIEENCRWNELAFPAVIGATTNIRPGIVARLGGVDPSVMSSQLAALVGAPDVGPAHDALADCRSIAVALRHLQDTGRL